MTPPRIVIVGGGFAGYHAARTLCRKLRDQAEVVLLNPRDYFSTCRYCRRYPAAS